MKAYHNDPAIKAKYLARIRAHAAADAITQGVGWENGKGCAIGCTLENYDHSRYPIELGIPEWLAQLEDAIFEGLPEVEAMAWPEAFLEAITPGADLEPVRPKLALLRIDWLIALQTGNTGKHGKAVDAVIAQTIAALHAVRRYHESEIGGNVCNLTAAVRSASASAWSAWWSAESVWSAGAAEAVRSAVRSAESAVRSASASAWSAWWSAESAESVWSASASAWSAWWSAESAESAGAARWAAYRREASDLLRLLREAQA